MRDEKLMWCEKHDDVATLYPDGSISCQWELIVETRTHDHVLVELPEIVQLKGWQKDAVLALRIASKLAPFTDLLERHDNLIIRAGMQP